MSVTMPMGMTMVFVMLMVVVVVVMIVVMIMGIRGDRMAVRMWSLGIAHRILTFIVG
jgi:hypothetical protein